MTFIVADPVQRLHDLEADNAALREAVRLLLPYALAYKPRTVTRPWCDSPDCVICGEQRAHANALAAARAALGEEMP